MDEVKDFLVFVVAGLVFGYCFRVLYDAIYAIVEVLI